MKVIDVSGLGHSGKTAATDLLREVEGIKAHNNSFEFNLLRLPDGLIDLYYAIIFNWSPIRSDFAIKRYRKLCVALNDLYSENLNQNFLNISEEYIASLVDDKLHMGSWYNNIYNSKKINNSFRKFLKTTYLFNISKLIFRSIWPIANTYNKKIEVNLVGGDMFIEKTVKYLEEILFLHLRNKFDTVVTNNAFEPFNPSENLKYFRDAFSIIIDRDPRDIYASVIKSDLAYVPNFETDLKGGGELKHLHILKEDMLGVKDINTFIFRQKLIREKMKDLSSFNKILKINYESLVLNYDNTIDKIFSFLKIDKSRHTMKNKFFVPKESKKNIGIFKLIEKTKEIKKITAELEPYLVIGNKFDTAVKNNIP